MNGIWNDFSIFYGIVLLIILVVALILISNWNMFMLCNKYLRHVWLLILILISICYWPSWSLFLLIEFSSVRNNYSSNSNLPVGWWMILSISSSSAFRNLFNRFKDTFAFNCRLTINKSIELVICLRTNNQIANSNGKKWRSAAYVQFVWL